MGEPRVERAVTVGVLVVAALFGTALVSLDSGSTRAPSVEIAAAPAKVTPSSTTIASPSPATTPAATTTTTAAPTTTATGDPGALPQTAERPTASGPTFTVGAQGLWQAIKEDRPELGMHFFFPKSAYLQVKAISDPTTDYAQRLIANYEQDIHTLHAQLGAGAADAQFVGVDVPGSQAVFVQPGAESNKLSYWRVYGTTLQYDEAGHTSSFPVTSLISWRGEWYVVHLGAIR